MAIDRIGGASNKILPTVFNDALSYYEVICKIAERLEKIENVLGIEGKEIIVSSDEVTNESSVDGDTVTEALDALLEMIEELQDSEE